MPQEIDVKLDLKVQAKGGFKSGLNWTDRQRLRQVVKKVHMEYYPTEMVTDLEADRMIDAIAPETAAYLIQRNWKNL